MAAGGGAAGGDPGGGGAVRPDAIKTKDPVLPLPKGHAYAN